MAKYLHPELAVFNKFKKELNQESDRGAAIMATTMIDWTLERMLKNFFVHSKITNELFEDINGPLKSLANKLKIAYSLGLISKLEYDECSQLRKIRNEFAHKFEINFSFNDPKIKSISNKIQIRETIEVRSIKKPKQVFINIALMMVKSFLFRRQLAEGRIEEEQNIS